MYACASCRKLSCDTEDLADAPAGCPSTDPDVADDLAAYLIEPDRTLAHQAALVEASGYCRLTRVQEIMDFARRCGYERLGIAFCIGLRREAEVFARILRANGFTVDSVVCKNGSHPKESLGIADDEKIEPGTFEPMCNPIGQARRLEKAGTQLNVMLGLCVGHDSLFLRHSHAPVTVLAVKDRVLGHNPLAAVYTADGYYKKKLSPVQDGQPETP
jgi:uncharacterized metal-binding protein